MITLAFFFLLRSGKYTGLSSDTQPFWLCDVALYIGPVCLVLATATRQSIWSATFGTLEFTDQKNGVCSEVFGLSKSGNPQFCPVLCLARRILHLCDHNAPWASPIAQYHANNKLRLVKPADIMALLRLAMAIMGPSFGFLPTDISTCSLCTSSAMALLCAKVDTNLISLIGCWRSHEMLHYLHVQAICSTRGPSHCIPTTKSLFSKHTLPLFLSPVIAFANWPSCQFH